MARATLAIEPRLVERSFFPFWHAAIIRHADLDPNNHVTNSVICAWFDDGRYTLLCDVVLPLLEPGDYPVLASVTIDFHREIRFGSRPEIGTAVHTLGNRSLNMVQGIFCDGQCVATATSVTVLVDGKTGRPRPVGEAVAAALGAFAGRKNG